MLSKIICKDLKEPLVIGVIIFVALILFSLMVFFAGDFTIKRGFNFFVLFKYSDGVLKNTPVNISGVNYGQVNNIKIVIVDDEPFVEMEIRLKAGNILFQDAKIFISTVGFMGEKIIEIDPGKSSSGLLEKGERIRGIDPVRNVEMVERIFDILKNTDKIVSSVTEIFYTDDTKQQFMVILENLKNSSYKIDNIITENQEIINRAINNMENTTANLLVSSANINNLVDTSETLIINTLTDLNQSSSKLSGSINEVSSAIPGIVKNIETTAEQAKIIAESTNLNLNSILNNFKFVSENVKQLSDDIKNPEYNVGSFIYSKEIYNNITAASDNIKNATQYIKYNPWVLFRSRSNPLTEEDFK